MNKSKVNDALANFKNSCNCSQAIFSTYCEDLGLDKMTALKIASGLGAGQGRLQETCGAVSGAYLLIGLKHGHVSREDSPAKEKTYALIREFAALFRARNKTTSCRELLGVDLMNDDSQTASERMQTVCPKMVQDAAEITEQILFSDNMAE